MANYYYRKDFEYEITQSRSYIRRVVEVGNFLVGDIKTCLKNRGIKGEVLITGSTNLQRLTCVVDPKSPDQRYPSDFDIGIVTKEPLHERIKAELLECFLPYGTTKTVCKRMERHGYREKFPIGMTILSEEEASKSAPIIYSSNFADFTADEVMEVRALRLFCMRNGLYGGFTRGFKGIFLERLVKEKGPFYESALWLYNQLEKGAPIEVPNPIDGINLAKNVSSDIWGRLHKYLGIFFNKGKIASFPYGFERWDEDHPGEFCLSLLSSRHEPFEDYQRVSHLSKETLGTASEKEDNRSSVLVIPSYRNNSIFLSAKGLSPLEKETFGSNFTGEWDSSNGH